MQRASGENIAFWPKSIHSSVSLEASLPEAFHLYWILQEIPIDIENTDPSSSRKPNYRGNARLFFGVSHAFAGFLVNKIDGSSLLRMIPKPTLEGS
jgi:hypothetical protein